MCAFIHQLNRIVTGKISQRTSIKVNADVAHRGRLAFHDRTATEMGFNIGVVRRHHGDDGLAQARGRLRAKIVAQSFCSDPLYWISRIDGERYDVKKVMTIYCGGGGNGIHLRSNVFLNCCAYANALINMQLFSGGSEN